MRYLMILAVLITGCGSDAPVDLIVDDGDMRVYSVSRMAIDDEFVYHVSDGSRDDCGFRLVTKKRFAVGDKIEIASVQTEEDSCQK